jgi:Gpi18-like mannosyltransferase
MAFLNFDKQTVQSDKLFYIITAILFVVAVIVVFFTEGTNGSGDSVSHFMIAHFAWKHPYLFFDHWGKPLFTMLSSPFAFFGMKGLKLFNVLLSFTSLMIIHTLAKRFHHTKVLWILPIYFCAPEGVNVMFSGLTEPLFACLFALAVYLLVTKKQALAIVVVSFLPLSRSEGLIILIVFVLYFLIHKKFKLLPFFFVGGTGHGSGGGDTDGQGGGTTATKRSHLPVLDQEPLAPKTQIHGEKRCHFFCWRDWSWIQ